MPAPVRNHPLVALRTMAGLVRDPDDLPKVFALIENLPGRAPMRMLERMRALPAGRRLLASRPELAARLVDRDALHALPAGSLGRVYAEFAARNGISAEGIIEAAAAGRAKTASWPADLRFVEERMRDTHDLWHVVTGYETDVGGELAVLAFVLAQSFHPGIALICGLAYVRGLAEANALMRDAFRRGRRAAWLPAVAWEDLLARPLTEVRTLLGVGDAPSYAPITNEELLPWRTKAAA